MYKDTVTPGHTRSNLVTPGQTWSTAGHGAGSTGAPHEGGAVCGDGGRSTPATSHRGIPRVSVTRCNEFSSVMGVMSVTISDPDAGSCVLLAFFMCLSCAHPVWKLKKICPRSLTWTTITPFHPIMQPSVVRCARAKQRRQGESATHILINIFFYSYSSLYFV